MVIKKIQNPSVGWKGYSIIQSDFLRNVLKFMLAIQFDDQLVNTEFISSSL